MYYIYLLLWRTRIDKATNKSVRMECVSGNLLRNGTLGVTLEKPRQKREGLK